ncbi:hypothetical protein ABIB51_003197 [Arthrobacter sp. UYCu712]
MMTTKGRGHRRILKGYRNPGTPPGPLDEASGKEPAAD